VSEAIDSLVYYQAKGLGSQQRAASYTGLLGE
jgi:hypothetical protein